MSVDVAIMIVGTCASIIAAVSACIAVVLIEDVLRRLPSGQLVETDPDPDPDPYLERLYEERAAADRLKAR